MEPIGGYFELELRKGAEYHGSALGLNSGSNAFRYLLQNAKYSRVFLPHYICSVMVQPVLDLGKELIQYPLDSKLYPDILQSALLENDVLLYVNYFGICDENVDRLVRIGVPIIIDNSQAFYAKPVSNTDTFYSPRKFFGVPDGAYLYSNKIPEQKLEQDISHERTRHLLGRLDEGPEKYLPDFRENNLLLSKQDIKTMSNLTRKIMRGIDYEQVKEVRMRNFNLLYHSLNEKNELKFDPGAADVPMAYPLLLENGREVKKQLIAKKIFVPTYWPEVLVAVDPGSWEYHLAVDLVALPIDQRYGDEEMLYILECINEIK
jgi:hypothetical protein